MIFNRVHTVSDLLNAPNTPLYPSVTIKWYISGMWKQVFRVKKLMGCRGAPELELLANNFPGMWDLVSL